MEIKSPEGIVRDYFRAWINRDITRMINYLLGINEEFDGYTDELVHRIADMEIKLERLMTDSRHIKEIVEVGEPTYIDNDLATVRVVIRTTEHFPGSPDPEQKDLRILNVRLKRFQNSSLWRIHGGI